MQRLQCQGSSLHYKGGILSGRTHSKGGHELKHVSRLLVVLVVNSVCLLSGCIESSFSLADDSRLPAFVKLPPTVRRQDVSLTLNYYSNPFGPNAKFILKNKRGDVLERLRGNDKHIGNNLSEYPLYVRVVVNGVPEIIEHRTKGPIFTFPTIPLSGDKTIGDRTLKGRTLKEMREMREIHDR